MYDSFSVGFGLHQDSPLPLILFITWCSQRRENVRPSDGLIISGQLQAVV